MTLYFELILSICGSFKVIKYIYETNINANGIKSLEIKFTDTEVN